MRFGRWLRSVQAHAWCALLWVLVFAAAPAAAASLTSVKPGTLPTLPAPGPLLGITNIDGVAVAVQRDAAWTLAADTKQWRRIDWQGAPVQGVFGGDDAAYLLSGNTDAATAVERLRRDGGALQRVPLPVLPVALHEARGAAMGEVIFVSGRDGTRARLLRFDPAAVPARWTDVPGVPFDIAPSTLAAQTRAVFASIPGASGEVLWRWSSEAGWSRRAIVPGRLVPGSGRALGQAHVLYLVRDPGASNAPAQLKTFQTITSAWAVLPGAAATAPVASGAWTDGIAWARAVPGGYRIEHAQVQPTRVLLKWQDWAVIVLYLASMIGIGLYFYLREKRNSTSSFFVGGRSIPFWAAGVSLYAANTSSISFIAIPAKAFETNWQYLTNNLIAVLGLMFVAVWIVPLLRRLDLMSVFSYLETRFHPAIRMLASALAILTQIGSRMSVILLLPALAISTITGLDVTLSIVLMGGFTIIYTAMGGMKAVIWTDFVQVIVKMGGAIFAIGFMIWSLRGGLPQFWEQASAEDKMHLFDFRFDLTQATVWGFIFLVLFDVVLTFPKDQVLMQRTLSTSSDREAGRSIWAFAAIMIPGGFVFYMIGTALFVYYKNNPERMNPLLPVDATFPLFIGAELPVGVTGLIIAGIFAAAMATLSGIMNSVSTLVSVDFYERLVKDRSQKKSVFFAEIMTVVVGLIGIGVAVLLSKLEVHSLFDVSIELAGLLGGGFAGAYTLGMFTRRANSPGVAIGIGCSIVLTLVAWHFNLVHPYFYLAISILLCIVIGYLASLLFPAPTRSLNGLTIYRDLD